RKQLESYLGPLTTERFNEIAGAHMGYQLTIYKDYLRALPDVTETLRGLKQRSKRLAVVTSRRKQTLNLYLQACDLDGFFDYFVTPEDTNYHKPHPEPALKALELLGALPQEALLVGDSDFDLECARGAGIDSALICHEHVDADTMTVTPTYTLTSLLQLCEIG
ncbi:MAG: HAD-IA family hydrolase, partial [Chitinivibrionales bacterium]|nr:HAD-IA family hydrolase [Chitinivibrionales bacterium]